MEEKRSFTIPTLDENSDPEELMAWSQRMSDIAKQTTGTDSEEAQAYADHYNHLAQQKMMAESGVPETPRDLTPLQDVWRRMATSERAPLEKSFQASGDKEGAINEILQNWDTQFGMPRKVVEYSTDRDIYNALKEVYDQSNGDWDMVYRVAKYNEVPKELMDKFVQNGQWTDWSLGNEWASSGTGAVARGATGGLYGGLANILTGGGYADKYLDVVPEGLNYEDAAHTLWRAGINQAKNYGRSLMETDPGLEIGGQIAGFLVPAGIASKATKGLKISEGATRLGRSANTAYRGAATGALASIPSSLAEDSVLSALGNTAQTAGTFAAGDVAFSGLGDILGAFGRGVGRISKRAATVPENYIKAFEKIKPIEQMSKEEIARGLERGWLKNGKLNVSKYLADEYGVAATDTMTDLWRVAKNNREVYNQLRSELEHFHYKDAVIDSAKKAMIPNAPLSKVNQVLKSIPERLDKFLDDIVGYAGMDGTKIAESMKAFNQDVKHALRSIKNPNALEKQAIENYLKEIESNNMLQFMKKAIPTEFSAMDKNKTLLSEMARIFNITNPISAGRAAGNTLQNNVTRNYMRQVMAGEQRRATSPLQKMLQRVSSASEKGISSKNLERMQRLQDAALVQSINNAEK